MTAVIASSDMPSGNRAIVPSGALMSIGIIQALRLPGWAMSRLMLKSAKRALLIENLRILRGLGKMRVR
jgi:hypothetical protein